MMRRKFYQTRRLLAGLLCTAVTGAALWGCAPSSAPSGDTLAGKETDTADIETDTSCSEELPSQTESEAFAEQNPSPEVLVPRNQSTVAFSVQGGIYPESFSLTLAAAPASDSEEASASETPAPATTAATVIYYTTDGSDPAISETRLEYTGSIEITERSNDANVVSAVDPVLFCGNFCDYNRGTQTFDCKISPPEDDAVDKCTIIRAAAASSDGTYSKTCTQTYFIGTPEEHIQGLAKSCEAAGTGLAVISISMAYEDLFDSQKGIYVKGDLFQTALEEQLMSGESIDGETARALDANYKQRGRDWERSCHIDFFEFSPEGVTNPLSQDCGIRIQGNYSRSDLQKGFRLFARKSYDTEGRFHYAVFGDSLTSSEGAVIDSFDSLVLRAGGNCAFLAKYNDIYWQTLIADLNVSTKASRPCVVYLNGEYWGLYILEEDYSQDYFADHYGVDSQNVIIYKGDAETYASGYKLDEGTLPQGETDEGYYFQELMDFFNSHDSLKKQEDYDAFAALVDVESARDYFLSEIWINNKWDWPGKNWSMWKVLPSQESPYADGRWRFICYDMEFGGISGEWDATTNTIREDNYKPKGLLDMDTKNPAVLCYAYLMTNEAFREDFCNRLAAMGEEGNTFEKRAALELLQSFEASYSPLYEQFFARYPETGTPENSLHGGYGSSDCIRAFLQKRNDNIQSMINWVEQQY